MNTFTFLQAGLDHRGKFLSPVKPMALFLNSSSEVEGTRPNPEYLPAPTASFSHLSREWAHLSVNTFSRSPDSPTCFQGRYAFKPVNPQCWQEDRHLFLPDVYSKALLCVCGGGQVPPRSLQRNKLEINTKLKKRKTFSMSSLAHLNRAPGTSIAYSCAKSMELIL